VSSTRSVARKEGWKGSGRKGWVLTTHSVHTYGAPALLWAFSRPEKDHNAQEVDILVGDTNN
jgi:hypothetical protein